MNSNKDITFQPEVITTDRSESISRADERTKNRIQSKNAHSTSGDHRQTDRHTDRQINRNKDITFYLLITGNE